MPLTLKLGPDLPAVRGKAAENVTLSVTYEEHGGAAALAAAHHPCEALAMQVGGEEKPPGGTVARRQQGCQEEQQGHVQQALPQLPPRVLAAQGQQGEGRPGGQRHRQTLAYQQLQVDGHRGDAKEPVLKASRVTCLLI